MRRIARLWTVSLAAMLCGCSAASDGGSHGGAATSGSAGEAGAATGGAAGASAGGAGSGAQAGGAGSGGAGTAGAAGGGGAGTSGGAAGTGGGGDGGASAGAGGAGGAGSGGVAGSAGAGATPPVDLAFIVHLEGHDSGDQNQFAMYVGQIRTLMDTFEAEGAKLTFESESVVTTQMGVPKESLVQGIQLYGDNVLTEAVSRGHWVGLHGGLRMGIEATQAEFEKDLADQTALIETVGIEPHHVSNICSALDWVSAVGNAGFLYVTSIVEYCGKSLPLSLQDPSTQQCTAPNECHNAYPFDVSRRLHPWRAGTPDWVTPDPNGPLVVIAGVYNFTCIAEEIADPTGNHLGCKIDDADVTAYQSVLDAALLEAAPNTVTTVATVWSFGGHPTSAELPTVKKLLASLASDYVATGKARFATTEEIYEEFVASE